MDKKLVKALLRIVQSQEKRFFGSDMLRGFLHDYRIGYQDGVSCIFDEVAKVRVREMLVAQGIKPTTAPDGWTGLSRAESLSLGKNEKWSGVRARRDRLAVKTLPNMPLCIAGRALHLPPAAHLEVDLAEVVHHVGHEQILLVENWECFNQIHAMSIEFSAAGSNPLVIWRGGNEEVRADGSRRFMDQSKLPVWAFVDFDPSGLVIAANLPHLQGVIQPEDEKLVMLLQAHGLEDRYARQLPQAEPFLNRSTNPSILALWPLLRKFGRALPQEIFIRPRII